MQKMFRENIFSGENIISELEHIFWTIISSFIRRFIVDAMMLLCYIGIGSVYIVFIAGTIQECVGSEKIISQSYYALLLFPFLFIMNCVRNLADIVPISIAGNVLLVTAGIIGIVYALKDGINDTWVMIGSDFSLYPKFVGMVFFSMCSPGLVSAYTIQQN